MCWQSCWLEFPGAGFRVAPATATRERERRYPAHAWELEALETIASRLRILIFPVYRTRRKSEASLVLCSMSSTNPFIAPPWIHVRAARVFLAAELRLASSGAPRGMDMSTCA